MAWKLPLLRFSALVFLFLPLGITSDSETSDATPETTTIRPKLGWQKAVKTEMYVIPGDKVVLFDE